MQNTLENLNPFKEKSIVDKSKDSISNASPFGENSILDKVKSAVDNVNPLSKSKSEKALDSITSASPFKSSPMDDAMSKLSMDKSSMPSMPSISTEGSTSTSSWVIRLLLLFIILALLSANLITYMQKGTDVFSGKLRTFFSTSGKSFFDTVEKGFDNTVEGTYFSSGILKDSVKSVINLLKGLFIVDNLSSEEKKVAKMKVKNKKNKKNKKNNGKSVEDSLKDKKNNENVKPDISESEIQKKVEGFCFIGHQAPHNACIKVTDTSKCLSGKIFKTQNECENYKPDALI